MEEQILAAEIEEGNIEHKLILKPSEERLQGLISQMKWRLKEGNGEAIYELGCSDDGVLVGLTETELKDSLETLKQMANELKADISIVRKVQVDSSKTSSPVASRYIKYHIDNTLQRYAVEVLVRQRLKVLASETRILVFGNPSAGKTSLLGVLAHDELDDGKGSTRLNIFRHRHEVESGKTSSIQHACLGFSSTGQVVRSDVYWAEGPEQSILETSAKVITFVDTGGEKRYSKTAFTGLASTMPNYLCVVVSVLDKGLDMDALHMLEMARILNDVPAFVVVTKQDRATEEQVGEFLQKVKDQLQMPSFGAVPCIVNSDADVVKAANSISRYLFLI